MKELIKTNNKIVKGKKVHGPAHVFLMEITLVFNSFSFIKGPMSTMKTEI